MFITESFIKTATQILKNTIKTVTFLVLVDASDYGNRQFKMPMFQQRSYTSNENLKMCATSEHISHIDTLQQNKSCKIILFQRTLSFPSSINYSKDIHISTANRGFATKKSNFVTTCDVPYPSVTGKSQPSHTSKYRHMLMFTKCFQIKHNKQ